MAVTEPVIGSVLRLDRGSALAFLRDLARDRATLADLRGLFARETGRSSLTFFGDDQVLEQLAEWIATRRLTVAAVRTPGEWAVPEMAAADDQPGEEVPAPAETIETASLTNARWSADRVAVGAEVQAAFTYQGLRAGASVTIKVFECDAGGGRKEIDSLQTKVPDKSGDHQVPWSRSADEAQADLEADEEEGDSGPVEYRFTAESAGAGSTGESGPLWLTNTVVIDVVNEEDGEPAADGLEITLIDALGGEHRGKAKDGKAEFKGVLVGRVTISTGG